MKPLIIFFILACVFSCGNNSQDSVRENIPVLGIDTQHIMRNETDDSYAKNSTFDTITEYYENGSRKSIIVKSDESRASQRLKFYKNGQKKSENHYLNDTLNGPSFTYYKNGQIELSKNYKMGKPEGESLWYRTNGVLREKIIEKNGEITWVGKYNEHGKLIYEALFEDGKVINSQVY